MKMITIESDLGAIIYCLSRTLDISASGIANHHRLVPMIALGISEKLGLTTNEKNLVFLSALVHDAGIIKKEETEGLIRFEDADPFPHCQRGYEIFSASKYTQPIGEIILYHHDRWKGKKISETNVEGNLISNIIYLSDRVAALIEGKGDYILHCNKVITEKIKKGKGTAFNPVVVEAFLEAANKEGFWLDLKPQIIDDLINSRIPVIPISVTPDELADIAGAFATIIDNKSPYTYNHSKRVAKVGEFLAGKMGLPEHKKTLIKVAGYLHDLGKVSIPNEILDKPSKLTDEEFAIIKKHSFFSYRLLEKVPGFEKVAAWGAHHHEKLDGSGYPFGLSAKELPCEARIIAVSDMFVAITEDRPYRKGLDRKNSLRILKNASDNMHIDKDIVNLVDEYYQEIVNIFE